MKIEVWFDYVCPFCYLGKRHLDIALKELHLTDNVAIEFKSYQLNPDMPPYSGKGIAEHLSEKYDISPEEAMSNLSEVQERARKVELFYDFENMKLTNSFDAHRLTQYARTLGKDHELAGNIFEVYFEKGGLISDIPTLLKIAEASGLSRNKANEVLMDPQAYKEEVERDMALAEEQEIESVPYFLINNEHVIPGSETIETFIITLQKVLKEPKEPGLKEAVKDHDR
jgi:predicted DsbA family dithiol-disulfide isomerase